MNSSILKEIQSRWKEKVNQWNVYLQLDRQQSQWNQVIKESHCKYKKKLDTVKKSTRQKNAVLENKSSDNTLFTTTESLSFVLFKAIKFQVCLSKKCNIYTCF